VDWTEKDQGLAPFVFLCGFAPLREAKENANTIV
jgi:hypothetical protein